MQKETLKSITDYLYYLRDVSRKIAYRSGFDKCFLPSKEYPRPFHQTNDVKQIYNHYEKEFNVFDKLKPKDNTCCLFLGFGMFAGVLEQRTIAAPLFIMPCYIQNENNELQLEFELEEYDLNYDILSTLAIKNKNQREENEEYNFSPQESRVIEDAENMIEQFIKENLPENNISNLFRKLNKFSLEIYKKLKNDILYLKNIADFPSNYEYDEEYKKYQQRKGKRQKTKPNDLPNECSIFEKEITFVNAAHFFVNAVPSELSTYEALNKFVKHLEQEKRLESKIVEKLLVNALTEEQQEIEKTEIENEIRDIITKFLPMSLSETQIKAIINAFSCDLSYIQGPPGTGKSHTICAIILTALMQNKKVLVVSQKTAACRVIKEKLEPYLSSNQSSLGIAYFNDNNKKIIADYCKNFHSSNIIFSYEEKLKNLTEKLKETDNNLRKALQYNNDYTEKHKEFIRKLKHINLNWFGNEIEEPQFFLPKRLNDIDGYNEITRKLKIITDKAQNTLATRLFTNKIKKHLNKRFKIEKEFLEKKNDITPFFESFIELNLAFTETEKTLEKLKVYSDINEIRKRIKDLKKEINQIQKEFIKQKLETKKTDSKKYDLDKFGKMLRYVNPSIVNKRMESINFDNVLEIIPFWTMEIRELGNVFPLKSGLFDMVIVDEASQVNLAEIIPAFYRGKKIVVVGDHKQLNLGASGLTFSLSSKFDELIWNKYNSMQYDNAKSKDLIVSKASILDFLKNDKYNITIPECMLDEHFRSLPKLANYTKKFYTDEENNKSMKIMTETPDKLKIDCFAAINVQNGKREQEQKTIPQEADRIVQIVESLLKGGTKEYPFPEHIDKNNFSIGIISMLRDQCTLIKEKLNSVFSNGELNKYDLNPVGGNGIGTPEEFQGNERDIMIFSLGLDIYCKGGHGHFQNSNRLNVATSRAKYFTYFVYSPFPESFNEIYKYLHYIKGKVDESDIKLDIEEPSATGPLHPLNKDLLESNFERCVCDYLEEFIKDKKYVTIHNQVTCCGQKRLDFVLVNGKNNKSVAIEVDGSYHFVSDNSKDYTATHIERMDILERAGWNVINTPYYLWYSGARLREENDKVLKTEIQRIYKEIENIILKA
jgi:superfamily I DNA and/or RNA helicase